MCSGKVHEELTVVFLLWVFATSLWSGQDPAATSYIQGPMRSHLLSVLLSKNIQPFPTRGLRCKIQQPRKKLIPVYCICRLTDTGTVLILR